MCIAIYSPADQELLSVEAFNESMDYNPDGMGLAYAENEEFKVLKTLSRGDLIYDEYKGAHSRGLNCLLHFRIATRGEVSVENCHPFSCGDKYMYVHNGTISFDGLTKDSDEVDSRLFAERILTHLPEGWESMPDIVRMVEKFISDSKIALMDRSGQVFILNEHLGNTDNGIWFSNYTFMASKAFDNPLYDTGYGHAWKEYWDRGPSKVKNDGYGFGTYSDRGKNYSYKKSEKRSAFKQLPKPVEFVDTSQIGEAPTDGREYGQGCALTDKEKWERTIAGFKVKQDRFERPLIDYPAGFNYHGFFICSYCAPSNSVLYDKAAVPVFANMSDEDDFSLPMLCEACNVQITNHSPINEVTLFDIESGEPVEVEDESEVVDLSEQGQGWF